MTSILLLAAVADNGVIGAGNTMPWRLKSDLRRFRARTMGKPVIIGRKTYQSIGRALPGRSTIVISRDPTFAAPGILVTPSLPAAVEVARGEAMRRGVDTIVVAGGAEVYAQAMPIADRLEITQVHARPPGETTFPAIDPKLWHEVARCEHPAGEDDEHATTFIAYARN